MFSSWLQRFLSTDLPVKKKKSAQRDFILEEEARRLLQAHSPSLAERVTIFWNPRMRTTAGLASYQRWEVILNPALQKISEAEVDKTLRHELAHLLARDRSGRKRIAPHGPEWRQACVDLGIPHESRTHQLPFVRRRQQRKFFYQCPSCKEILSRVRKPRHPIACLACCRKYAGGKYEERFRFEVKN
ncbi:MAG: SprT family zinc-dependent metalloprotease [Verrucomicrobia bacterium]|nr:SprT family zinc-dependent metalloprotease [Verrucomicrobiota bacterium]